jgi:hypothetical protein
VGVIPADCNRGISPAIACLGSGSGLPLIRSRRAGLLGAKLLTPDTPVLRIPAASSLLDFRLKLKQEKHQKIAQQKES